MALPRSAALDGGEVCIIVPAYNPGDRLVRALRSIQQQNFQDWRAIVVDDGSSEDLRWVTGLDPRISMHRQENAGVSVARNTGVSLSVSPLLAFLDQDDEWLPEKLAQQVSSIGDASLSHTDFWWVSKGAEEAALHAGPVTYTSVLAGGPPCLSSVVVPRRAFLRAGGFNGLLAQTQDYDLFLRLLMHGPAHHVATPLVRYHLHDSNASKDFAAGRAERRAILRLHGIRALAKNDLSARTAVGKGLQLCNRLYAAQALAEARAARAASQSPVAPMLKAMTWDPIGTARFLFRARPWSHRPPQEGLSP